MSSLSSGRLANMCIFNKKRPRYSMRSLSIIYCMILILITLAVLSSAATYYNKQLKSQMYDNTDNVLTHFNNITGQNFSTIEKYLYNLGYTDTNISILSTVNNSQDFYHAKMSVYYAFRQSTNLFSLLNGMFVYSPSADDYTPYIGASSTVECSEYIRSWLSENRDSIFHMKDMYNSWLLYQTNNNNYLIRYIISGNAVLGAWTNLSSLSQEFNNVFDKDAVICFMDNNQKLLQADLFPSYVCNIKDSDNHEIFNDTVSGRQYIVVIQKVSYSDCYIAVFLPTERLSEHLFAIYQRFFLLAVIILLTVAVISFALKRLVDAPVKSIDSILTSIHSNEDILIPENSSHCVEVNELYHVLNSMITEIRSLKIHVYEEELAKSKLELQFLKAQISPHFLINCLTTFSFLASSSEDNRLLAHRLAETLSQHIRYSFCSKELIPLSQEQNHMDNYLELACIRYPQSLVYNINVPDECRTCMLPPMLLLTLCENTIKHNLIMGEKLKIIVSAELITEKMYHITYIDSGSGYPQEILDLNNHILDHPEITTEGYHIGIYNIAKTLDISYHKAAEISFSNEPGMGARVDIFIPCPSETSNMN